MTWQTVATAATSTIFNTDNLCCEIALDKPKEYLNFNVPPLALVIAMIERNKSLSEIVETLHGAGSTDVDMPERVVTAEHLSTAEEIYKHFANKITMRRLKNEHISKWMLAVDELCETQKRIDKGSLSVIVTLPKFYRENQELESLIKRYKSFPNDNSNWNQKQNFDEVVTFVKKIERRFSRGNFNDYYWSTKNGYLIKARLESSNVGSNAWDYISKVDKVRMKAEWITATRLQGYDYFVLQTHTQMEILPV